MEISSARWMSEWEMEDTRFMDEFEIEPFDFSFDEFKFEESERTTELYWSSVPPLVVEERAAKQLKVGEGGGKCQMFGANNNNNNKADSSSSSSHILSFENSNPKCGKGSVEPKIEMAYESDGNLNFFSSPNITDSWNHYQYNNHSNRPSYGQGIKRGGGTMNNRNPSHAREHVIAERKRREKLSQRFIALSALIPGLNKVDKASILGGAIRHVKELQERMKVVEEQSKMSKTSEEQSAVYVKRTSLQASSSDEDTSSSDENSVTGGAVPEIEARISNKDVLIRIHCHKRKGCLSYLLHKIENLNLTVLNSTAFPFSHSNLDITIVAQVDVGFCMTVEDVVKNLRQALLDFK